MVFQLFGLLPFKGGDLFWWTLFAHPRQDFSEGDMPATVIIYKAGTAQVSLLAVLYVVLVAIIYFQCWTPVLS